MNLGKSVKCTFYQQEEFSIGTKDKIDPIHTSEGIWGSGGVASLILNLSFSWRRVVSLMLLLLQLCERTPWSLFNRRLGGSQIRYGCLG